MRGLKLLRECLAVAIVIVLVLFPQCITAADIRPVAIRWAEDIEVDVDHMRKSLKREQERLRQGVQSKDAKSMKIE